METTASKPLPPTLKVLEVKKTNIKSEISILNVKSDIIKEKNSGFIKIEAKNINMPRQKLTVKRQQEMEKKKPQSYLERAKGKTTTSTSNNNTEANVNEGSSASQKNVFLPFAETLNSARKSEEKEGPSQQQQQQQIIIMRNKKTIDNEDRNDELIEQMTNLTSEVKKEKQVISKIIIKYLIIIIN